MKEPRMTDAEIAMVAAAGAGLLYLLNVELEKHEPGSQERKAAYAVIERLAQAHDAFSIDNNLERL